MTRVVSFFFLALFATSLPTSFAGPACSRKHWKSTDCVQKCKSKWGWSDKMMGNDPWGAVMQKSDSNESWDATLSKACGVEPTQGSPQPVANVQSGSVTFPSTPLYTATASEVDAGPVVSTPTASPPTASSTSSKSPTPPSLATPVIPTVASTTSTKVNVPKFTTSTTPAPFTQPTPKASPVATKAPESPPPPPPNGGSGSSGGTSNSDIQAYLSSHNSVRASHGASPLTWSNDLAAKAQQWANGCAFKHSGGSLGRLGENLAAGTGPNYSIQAAVKSWTDEVTEYNPSNPQPSHFTQVVWKASTQVGCAIQSCDGIFDASFGKARYYVCEYSEAGNVIGHFAENVQV